MIRVLVVDDHAIVRQGLKQIVSETGDIQVVGETGVASEAMNCIRSQELDVVVLDISMPGRGGFELLRDILDLRPRLPVLMLSMYPEDQLALRALKAGARGYLCKEGAPDELVEALRRVASGRFYVSPSLGEYLALELAGVESSPSHNALSTREFQVFVLLASGRPVNAVAEELCLSVKTISTYRSRILEKMGLKTNADLTRYAINQGLIQ